MSVNSPKIKSSCSNRCVQTVLWHSADLYCMKDDSLQAEGELKNYVHPGNHITALDRHEQNARDGHYICFYTCRPTITTLQP